ncbi:MBL fold metallo-hydrolase [Mesorhizobium sp.]|uniref:MBL fold metallo-hydrolase n=1 Tax=Mesorhizobium sp. TaxID=1871066 RepID=UPI0025FBA39F|nr:MBL fold metallo-hydrolase [Mesorhizobium sp.]
MILRQFLHTDPVGISYLVGCGGKGTAAIIDPLADPDTYLSAAESMAVKIDYVIDTHVHADHISTWPGLATAGAKYILSSKADVSIPFQPVEDGEEIGLGNVVIEVMHTPGHTPEHICLLVTDRTRANDPWFVATGHTLMIGDVGRTELATSAEQGARDLFRSIRNLKSLPDHLTVLPGAYAGSVCGRSLSANPVSTLGFEKRFNKAFRIDDEAEFVGFMLEDIPPPPPRAGWLRATNSGRPLAAELP